MLFNQKHSNNRAQAAPWCYANPFKLHKLRLAFQAFVLTQFYCFVLTLRTFHFTSICPSEKRKFSSFLSAEHATSGWRDDESEYEMFGNSKVASRSCCIVVEGYLEIIFNYSFYLRISNWSRQVWGDRWKQVCQEEKSIERRFMEVVDNLNAN